MNRPGIIFQDIQRKIEDANVVIAEITAPIQNVYYEVGYAHALNKPTILLAQRGRELPFDIRSYRVIFYDDSMAGNHWWRRRCVSTYTRFCRRYEGANGFPRAGTD